jgi:acyl-[acyl-carrier-protein] desaturase
MKAISPNEILLEEISGDVVRLYDRHMQAPRLWYPHEQIDWGSGESFTMRAWAASDYELPAGVRSAILVNLITEDGLPYFTNILLRNTPANHPLLDWNHQWTTEENRHAMTMRDWVHISRCIDPVLLEDGRRASLQSGVAPNPETFADLICYTTLQERATQIAHRNTGSHLSKEDKMGRTVLGLLAGDETKHYFFYRDLAKAAFLVNPSLMMEAFARQASNFAMPGTAIPGFVRHAVRISREGIYGLAQYTGEVLAPVIEYWGIEHVEGLDESGERARRALASTLAGLKAGVVHAMEKASARSSVGSDGA